VAVHQEQHRVGEQLLLAEPVALLLGRHQRAQQRVVGPPPQHGDQRPEVGGQLGRAGQRALGEPRLVGP
jgi:hypothetical protein